ncbi:MAG: glycine cleavage system protein H [Peptococcaceae bacterium BRH_c4a]|nr:MAG: glycine cleavage system protein H [Peptococcaceae bacterium BRH_c4a]
MVPEGLLYSEDHEWIKVGGKTGRVGITHHAQEALGSVVFVELPEVGSRVAAGEALGVLESVKAASDYYSPVSGAVVAVNEELPDSPNLINEEPYDRGWLVELELDDPAQLDKLLTAEKYIELISADGK